MKRSDRHKAGKPTADNRPPRDQKPRPAEHHGQSRESVRPAAPEGSSWGSRGERTDRGKPDRDRGDSDIVYGIHAVEETLAAGANRVKQILIEASSGPGPRRVADQAAGMGIDVRVLPAEAFRNLSRGRPFQGVAARIQPFSYADPDELMEACSRDPNGILVALDSVQDPQNLGSVLRSAAFFGVRGVLLPRDRSVGVVPSVFRASAGAAAIVPVAQVVNLARALRRCLELDVTPVAAVARGGDSLSVLPASGPLVLVLGSEAEGLRRLVLEACPIRVTLPSPGKFESLNVGVTAGILMHAILAGRPSESVQ